MAFHIHWRAPSRIATGTKNANAGRLQWVLTKMAKSLGSLYTIPRWLLRRWRWKLGLKLSTHVITSKFSEILANPSYYMHYGTFLQQLRKVKVLEYFEHSNSSTNTINDCSLFSQVLLNGWITCTHNGWGPHIFQKTWGHFKNLGVRRVI